MGDLATFPPDGEGSQIPRQFSPYVILARFRRRVDVAAAERCGRFRQSTGQQHSADGDIGFTVRLEALDKFSLQRHVDALRGEYIHPRCPPIFVALFQ